MRRTAAVVKQQVRSALGVADRGYVLRRGAVELSGTVAELQALIREIEATYLAGVTEPWP